MSNNLTNYHSHCDFCDGRAPIEDFVKSAIEHRFTAYGISSHSPLPEYAPFNNVLQWDKVGEYISQINRLKAKYADQIEIYSAMEIDYIDSGHNPANEYFQGLELDYTIGSVHFLKVGEQTLMDADTKPERFLESLKLYYDNDIKRMITDYFEAKMRMISLGGFDFVAHADKVSMNASFFQEGVTQTEWYKDIMKDYFSFIGQKQQMIEINTKAFYMVGLFFPNEEHFEMLHQFNIPVVVNSDAHSPQLVNSGRAEAIERLKDVGYKTVRELHQGKWQDVEIK